MYALTNEGCASSRMSFYHAYCPWLRELAIHGLWNWHCNSSKSNLGLIENQWRIHLGGGGDRRDCSPPHPKKDGENRKELRSF